MIGVSRKISWLWCFVEVVVRRWSCEEFVVG